MNNPTPMSEVGIDYEEYHMRQYAMAGLLLASLVTPALATTMPAAGDTSPDYSYAAKTHWAVEDTVGNCAVIDAQPSYNLKILGDKGGYPSISAAEKEAKSASACKGFVSRA
jgi:hypothetical protein